MIGMTIAATPRNGEAVPLREGETPLSLALEALTSLVAIPSFGRFPQFGKFIDLSDSIIVVEAKRHLPHPRLYEVNPFPSGSSRFTYTFALDAESFDGVSAFRQLLVSAWAYAVAYPKLQSQKVSEFVENVANSPLSA
jgi:hypothetical protein